mgnify:CR=1 FL=1
MPNLTVFFAHGRESGPWGIKIRAMAKVAETLGCRVVSRDDSDVVGIMPWMPRKLKNSELKSIV